MYRKILISGVTAAAVLGAGGTAMALTGSDSTSGTPASSTSTSTSTGTHAKGKHHRLARLAHGQFVTKSKDGFVTHDLINGTVDKVSGTSITVTAADHKSETFAVTATTKVRMRTSGKGAASSISAVKDGDHVIVAGTGTSSYTAKHIVDVKK